MKHNNLHNIKNSGFKVPQTYFEDFDDTILAEIKFKSIMGNSGFKTPDNYFESFESVALDSNKNETKVIFLFNRNNLLLISSIAATIILFFCMNIFNKSALSISDLDTETVDNYILNEIEVTDLAALFSESELYETQFIDYSISDETLDAYLESVEVNELFLE